MTGSTRPVVVGHRGASAYRPEHTQASYALAVAQGADAVDVDVVATRDGVLVVRHDDEVGSTTDVADHPELAHLRTTRTVDGVRQSGWFVHDLTAAQVATLRARERLPRLRPASAAWDGRQGVMTLAAVLALRAELSAVSGREVEAWIECKHPTALAAAGLDVVALLLDALAAAGLDGADGADQPSAPVVVQCFETAALRQLHRARPHLRLLQLVDPTSAPPDLVAAGDPRTYADLITPAGLAEVASYAALLGPHKVQVHPREVDGTGRAASALVDDAHAAGLAVVPYTLRPENTYLPSELRSSTSRGSAGLAAHGDLAAEARRLWAAGVDGVFTDAPDLVLATREGAPGPG